MGRVDTVETRDLADTVGVMEELLLWPAKAQAVARQAGSQMSLGQTLHMA